MAIKIKRVPSKDPDDVLDYWIDYQDEEGDTIVSAEWTLPTDLTLISQTETNTRAIVWLSGGVLGTEYLFTGRVTTVAGRIFDQSFKLFVEEH